MALPGEGTKVGSPNHLAKSLGKFSPIDFQGILDSLPKLFFVRGLRQAALLLGSLFLNGCTPDWSTVIRPDAESLGFVRRVGCITGGEYSYPDNLTYRALKFTPVAGPDVFDITILDLSGLERVLRRHVIYQKSVFGHSGTALLLNAKFECVERIDVPWQLETEKPFYFADAQAIASTNQLSFFIQLSALVGVLILLTIGFVLRADDPRVGATKMLPVAAFGALAAFLGTAIFAIVWGLVPWVAANHLVDYYAFVDSLPKVPAGLLPLTHADFSRLFSGPPYPASLKSSSVEFGYASAALVALWFLFNSKSIAAALYAQRTASKIARLTPADDDCLAADGQPKSTEVVHMSEQNGPSTGGSVPMIDRVRIRTTIEERMRQASSVRTGWQAWKFEIEVAAAVRAMKAQALHAQALADCIQKHTIAANAVNLFMDATLETEVRRDLATEAYASRAEDERDRLGEAAHRRLLTLRRRQREELQAERETLAAKHSLQAERVFKREKFALGLKRYEARITEAHVGVVVAREAAGEMPGEAASLDQIIARKQKEITEEEADGTDTSHIRAELERLQSLAVQPQQAAGNAKAS